MWKFLNSEGLMALGLIAGALLAVVWELFWATGMLYGKATLATRDNAESALMFFLGLWAVWSVVRLWQRYARCHRILLERGLWPLLRE